MMKVVVLLAAVTLVGSVACASSPSPSAGSNKAPPAPSVAATCGGSEAATCPADQRCVDVPDDGCDPAKGGADCAGFCEPLHK